MFDQKYPFKLAPLPYAYNALEPFIDEVTMHLHHDKHHQTYVDKLNAAVANQPALHQKTLSELVANLPAVPEAARAAVRNHGGGHLNHSFFWPLLKKDTSCAGEIAAALSQHFGSVEKFKAGFTEVATTLFGSGWAWLVMESGKLKIITTANQDSPLSAGQIPLLTVDVWEHAYYLKYQNRRPEYVEAYLKVINWQKVNELYLAAK